MQGRYPWGQPLSTWDEVRAEIERRRPAGEPQQTRKDDEARAVSEVEDLEESSQVEGQLRPLTEEGRRVMVCFRHTKRKTRHGPKQYLYWRDENSGLVLEQFFPCYEKYPLGSKAIRNYLVGMGARPKRLDRVSLKALVGLRAEVFVETVKPEYTTGTLKGRQMPEALHYSKVAEILRPPWPRRFDYPELEQRKMKTKAPSPSPSSLLPLTYCPSLAANFLFPLGYYHSQLQYQVKSQVSIEDSGENNRPFGKAEVKASQ